METLPKRALTRAKGDRLQRFKRSPDLVPAPPDPLTERYAEILHHVYRYRFLRTTQIVHLTNRSEQKTQRRLRQLFHHSYLDRVAAKKMAASAGRNETMVYAIEERGARALVESQYIRRNSGRWRDKNRKVGERHVDHELMIADIMVGIESACRSHGYVRFITEDEILLAAPEATQNRLYPFSLGETIEYNTRRDFRSNIADCVFALKIEDDPVPVFFFLEADTGTMTIRSRGKKAIEQSSVYRKYLIYYAWWQAGHHKTDFNMSNFRVLFATSTQSRVRELIAANKSVNDGPGSTMFLFSDRRSLLEHPSILEAPWINGRGETTNLLE